MKKMIIFNKFICGNKNDIEGDKEKLNIETKQRKYKRRYHFRNFFKRMVIDKDEFV